MASVTMPQLGESVTEGTIGKWLKKEGERVAKYEPLVEVITDKVNSEIPSPEEGVLAQIVVPDGQTVKVGTEIAVIQPAGAEAAAAPASNPASAPTPSPTTPSVPAAGQPAQAAQQESPVAVAAPTAGATAASDGQGAKSAPTGRTEEELRRRSSPLVRRLAKEHNVDLSRIQGSGAGGRVTKEDMLAFIARQSDTAADVIAPSMPQAAPHVAMPPQLAPVLAEPFVPRTPPTVPAPTPGQIGAAAAADAGQAPRGEAAQDEEVIPTTPMRRAIAEHMMRSVTTAPHAWTYVEVDVSEMVKWRAEARQAFKEREGFDLSYLPFVAKALVETLREHPILNSAWRDGGVVLKRRIHLGVAVALEEGLVVPVIRNADEKSIAGLARALHDLATRARAGKLAVDDVQGGTFTLNNTGWLGSVLSMPIINQPQAAILTMEAIVKRAVVTPDDAIAIRPMMNVCLSFDHRVCDGLQVGRFMQSLKRRLEAMAPSQSIY